jgi:hypothetical protein
METSSALQRILKSKEKQNGGFTLQKLVWDMSLAHIYGMSQLHSCMKNMLILEVFFD